MKDRGHKKRGIFNKGNRRVIALVCVLALLFPFVIKGMAGEDDFRLDYTLSSEDWTRSNVEIRLRALGVSGAVDGIYLQGDDDALSFPGEEEASFWAEENGDYAFEAEDAQGNRTKPLTVTVSNIDKTPPAAPQLTLDGVERDGVFAGSCTITAEAPADGGSPIALYYTRLGENNNREEPYTGPIQLEESGEYRFLFTARDQVGNETSVQKSVAVGGRLDLSYENPILVEIGQDGKAAIDLMDYIDNPHGEKLVIQELRNAAGGTVKATGDTTVLFQMEDNFGGQRKHGYFAFTVADPEGKATGDEDGLIEGDVFILKPGYTVGPMTPDFTYEIDEGETLFEVNLRDKTADPDYEWDQLKLSIDGEPQNGLARVHNRSYLSYVPNVGFYGQDTVRYTVENPDGLTSSGVITINVEPDASPRLSFYRDYMDNWYEIPSKEGETYTVTIDENGGGSVLFYPWSPNPNADVTWEIVPVEQDSNSIHTSLIPQENVQVFTEGRFQRLSFLPLVDRSGEMRFRFFVRCDGKTIERYLNVKVRQVNTPPYLEDAYKIINRGENAWGELKATDRETPDQLSYRIHEDQNKPAAQNGVASVIQNQDGWLWQYVPNDGFRGEDTFYVDAVDPEGADYTATITVAVNGDNTAPTPPSDIRFDKDWFAEGEDILFTYTAGNDAAGETQRKDLRYDLQYTINGGLTWLPLADAVHPAMSDDFRLGVKFPAPDYLSINGLGVRVRAVDDDPFSPLRSQWAVSDWIMVNTPPRVTDQEVTVSKGGSVVIRLQGEDSDPGDEIGFRITSECSLGRLTALSEPGTYLYQHAAENDGYYDRFHFVAYDRRGVTSDPGMISISLETVQTPDPKPDNPDKGSSGGTSGGSGKDDGTNVPDKDPTTPKPPATDPPKTTEPAQSPQVSEATANSGGNGTSVRDSTPRPPVIPAVIQQDEEPEEPLEALIQDLEEKEEPETPPILRRVVKVSATEVVSTVEETIVDAGIPLADLPPAVYASDNTPRILYFEDEEAEPESAGLQLPIIGRIGLSRQTLALILALLIVLLLVLMWGFHIRIDFYWQDGRRSTKKTVWRLFQRINMGTYMELDLTDPDIEDVADARIQIRVGAFYRRRWFYEYPMRLYFAGCGMEMFSPGRRRYRNQGILINGSELRRILPDIPDFTTVPGLFN